MESEQFRAWSTGNALHHGSGVPLVLYHGTEAVFDRYQMHFSHSATGAAFNGAGIYFTSDAAEARCYGSLLKAAVVHMRKPAVLFGEEPESTLEMCERLGITSLRPRGSRATIGNIGAALREVSVQLVGVHKVPGHRPDFYNVHGTYRGELYSVHQRVLSEVADEAAQRRLLAVRILHFRHGLPDPSSLGPLGIAFSPFELSSALKDAGYDGVVALPAFPLKAPEYVAFSTDQIWDLGYIDQPVDEPEQEGELECEGMRP
ncbi:ADP-ribosyltransferase-containing protein [Xanthomonas citri]|uniref:ADP-ribosyltransferase-containing protein n=1 Tax=Xanthomonas citri TaxID=346 RepID=UPI000EFAA5E9|nr:hypothetical protein [Xanthomonas citri]